MLNAHYQNAYVTTDIDRAIAALRNQLGETGEVVCFEVTQDMWTAAAGLGEATMKLGFLQLGHLQYELIQPISGNMALYADAIAPDRLMTFHHVAMRADDIAKVQAEGEAAGFKVALKGENMGIKFLYLDARHTLGHYLEYVEAGEEFWAAMG